MATHIDVNDAQAWVTSTKLQFANLDQDLEAQVSAEVLARIALTYDVTTWTMAATTPVLVRKAIAMTYVGYYYQRTFSEDEGLSEYGAFLLEQANALIEAITSLAVLLPPTESHQPVPTGQTISFYPTDASSAMQPTLDDPSLGGAKFTMGVTW
jgi:hypothetical protein